MTNNLDKIKKRRGGKLVAARRKLAALYRILKEGKEILSWEQSSQIWSQIQDIHNLQYKILHKNN